jgi:iron complex outermembrane receptor protein
LAADGSGFLRTANAAESAGATAGVPEQLEEILVTAQKREQRLQDVGISITALSAQELKNYGVKEAEDIVNLVPSLQYNKYTAGAVVFNLRGVSQNDYGDQQEPPIAVYQDDSYASSLNLSGFPAFDLQRVEVLRGPQGTLFGRNATGGAIQYITNKPTKEFESYFSGTAGRFKDFDFEGAVSGPITPVVQGRLAFERSSTEGYLDDIYTGGRRAGADNYAIRGEVAAQPTDEVSTLLTVRYSRNSHETSAGMYSWEAAYPGPHGMGVFVGPNAKSPFGTCNGCDASGYKNFGIDAYYGGDPWDVVDSDPSNFDRTLRGADFKIEGEVAGINLVSISDYLDMSKTYNEASTVSPESLYTYYATNMLQQFSEEVRASGKSDMHDWVAGAFFMHLNGHYDVQLPFASLDYFPGDIFQQTTISSALFGQDEIKFADRWTLILGGRYWRDRRTLDFYLYDNFGTSSYYNSLTYPGLADRTFEDYSAKVEINRKITDDALVYLSWNRGSKSGGFTTSPAPPTVTPQGIEALFSSFAYNPEVLDAYELGVKTTLFGGTTTVNADVFYYDYKSYQAFIERIFGDSPVQTIVNIPAKEEGVELEIATRPVRGLTLSTGLSSLHSSVEDVLLADGTTETSSLPQAPTFSGHALARYQVPLATGSLAGQVLATYVGHTCFTLLCAPVDREAGHAISDASLTYNSSGDRWDVAFWVKNLANKEYRIFNSDLSFVGVDESIFAPPRTYGITVSSRFGAAQR